MPRRRSTARRRPPGDAAPSEPMPSPDLPPSTAPRRPAGARRAWLVGLAIALLALPLGGRVGSPAPVEDPPERGPDPAIDLSDAVTLTLEPTEGAPDGTVSVVATVGDAPLLEARGRLPFPLAVPRGQEVTVVVEAPGRARFYRRVIADEDGPLRVALPEGARLRGQIVDERGDPIADARVQVLREDVAQPPWTAQADADGRFEIDTLSAGGHRVQVDAGGHATAVRAGVEPGEVRLVLERAGTVAGRVLDPDGLGTAGASVQIAGSGLWPARIVTTDARGHFVMSAVPPGVYEVRARREGLVAEPRRGISIEPASRVFLTFSLQEGARLVGRVTNADTGEGIDGASVTAAAEALDVAPRAAVTAEDGRFTLPGLRDVPHRVTVTAPGYVPASAVEWSPGAPLEIALVPGGTLLGVVLDEDRQPIAGAHLEVLGDSDGQPVELNERVGFASAVFASQLSPMALEVTSGPVPPIPIDGVSPSPGFESPSAPLAPLPAVGAEAVAAAGYVTDEQGRFRIDGVPPGRVQIVARQSGYAPTATGRFYLGPGQTRDDLELLLPPAGELRARVLDARGDGVEGVLVEIRTDREPHPRVAFTDVMGELTLDAVVGELTVTAMPNGQPASRARVTIEPGGEGEVTLTLEGELHTLSGRTVDGRGFPVGSVQVSLVSLRSDAPHRRTVWSEQDGTFAIAGLPAPPWRLEASEPGHAPSQLDVFSGETEVQLPLERGAAIAGELLDDYTGEPVVGARVELVRDVLPAEILGTRTDGGGGFRVGRVRAATWRLVVRAEGYLETTQEVRLEDAGRGPRDLTLDAIRLTPAGRIEGTVVDALGHTVARARVWAGEASTRTDADGRYVLNGLAAGDVVPHAAHPAAGEVQGDAVRILEGRETLGVVLHLPERFDAERAATLEGRRRGVAIELAARDGALVISRVGEDSRAARVGLRPGDRVLRIDDETAADPAAARRALAGPPSVPAILRVERDGDPVDLLVDREVWIP